MSTLKYSFFYSLKTVFEQQQRKLFLGFLALLLLSLAACTPGLKREKTSSELLNEARVSFDKADYTGALEKSSKVIELDKSFLKAHFLYLKIMKIMKKEKALRKEYATLLTEFPATYLYHYLYAQTFSDYKNRILFFEKTKKLQENYIPLLFDLGWTYLLTNQKDKASRIFDTMLAYYPESSLGNLSRGYLDSRMGLISSARRRYEQASETAADQELKSFSFLSLAESWLKEENYEKAAKALKSANQAKPLAQKKVAELVLRLLDHEVNFTHEELEKLKAVNIEMRVYFNAYLKLITETKSLSNNAEVKPRLEDIKAFLEGGIKDQLKNLMDEIPGIEGLAEQLAQPEKRQGAIRYFERNFPINLDYNWSAIWKEIAIKRKEAEDLVGVTSGDTRLKSLSEKYPGEENFIRLLIQGLKKAPILNPDYEQWIDDIKIYMQDKRIAVALVTELLANAETSQVREHLKFILIAFDDKSSLPILLKFIFKEKITNRMELIHLFEQLSYYRFEMDEKTKKLSKNERRRAQDWLIKHGSEGLKKLRKDKAKQLKLKLKDSNDKENLSALSAIRYFNLKSFFNAKDFFDVLKNKNADIRFQALALFQYFQLPLNQEQRFDLLKDKDDRVRFLLASLILRNADRNATPILIKFLNHEFPEYRRGAVQLLRDHYKRNFNFKAEGDYKFRQDAILKWKELWLEYEGE